MIQLDKIHAAMLAKNFSPHTLRAYKRTISSFAAHLISQAQNPENISQGFAQNYFLQHFSQKSPSSQIQALAALRFFFRSLKIQNPFLSIELPRFDPLDQKFSYLQPFQVSQILSFLSQKQTYFDRLYYTLSLTLYLTATRFSEVATLDWFACASDQQGSIIALSIRGKGERHASLPVNPQLALALKNWKTYLDAQKTYRVRKLHGLHFVQSTKVFPNLSGQPISNQAFNAALARACRALNLPTVTAHSLRHSAATAMLDSGENLRVVQEVLRHKSIRNTQRYTHVSNAQVGNALSKLVHNFIP